MLDSYLEILELGYFEVGEAFKELRNEHVWKRPAPGLLSVGELAGHIAFWEAVRLASEDGEAEEDLTKCQVSSPLIDARFRYYPATIATPPSAEQAAMTAAQVCGELRRVHAESVASFKARHPDRDNDAVRQTFGESIKYLAFHVAYHTGQIYSVRHLLGEQTPDN